LGSSEWTFRPRLTEQDPESDETHMREKLSLLLSTERCRSEVGGVGIGSNVKSIVAGTLGNVMPHIVARMGGAAWRSWKVVY